MHIIIPLLYCYLCLLKALQVMGACSVMSDSVQPYGLQPARLLCSQDFPGKNTGMGCHFLLRSYIQQCVYVNSSLPIYPSPHLPSPLPPGNHNFVSYICDSNNNYFYGSDTHTSMCQVLLQTLFLFLPLTHLILSTTMSTVNCTHFVDEDIEEQER